MAAPVRFTKAEREFITQQVQTCRNAKEEKLRASILEKLEKSELIKGKGRGPGGMSYGEIHEVWLGVLGDRLVPAMGAFIGMVTKRVQMLGLNRADLEAIAKAAGAEWTGRIKEQSLANQAERLLSSPSPSPQHPKSTIEPPTKTPIGMGDL